MRILLILLATAAVFMPAGHAWAIDEDRVAAVEQLKMGKALIQDGDYAGAMACFEKALELNPNLKSAQRELERCEELVKARRQNVPAETPAAPAARPALKKKARAKPPVEKDSATPGWDAMWRSAIVPGWGQFHNGDNAKGLVLGAATIGLFIGGWVTYFQAETAAEEYLKLGANLPDAQYDQKYAAWESGANLNHTIDIAFGIAYTVTLIDALVSGRPRSQIQSRLKLAPGKIEVALLDVHF